MKIVDNRKKNTTTFETIQEGECFFEADNNDNELLIKIENLDDHNAVSLENGASYYFYPEEEVCVVDARVTIY